MPYFAHPQGGYQRAAAMSDYERPHQFIWCQPRIAATPVHQRTKGRVIRDQQRCHSMGTLPTQFNGDTDMTQQCLDHNSPWERSLFHRSNARMEAPLPTSLTGAVMTTQQCQNPNAPREGPFHGPSNATCASPFPISYRGTPHARRNATAQTPPPNLGLLTNAEMPVT